MTLALGRVVGILCDGRQRRLNVERGEALPLACTNLY